MAPPGHGRRWPEEGTRPPTAARCAVAMTTTTIPTPSANPVRGRLNAGFFRLVDRYIHHVLGARKAALFADLPGTVVELGAGTGANTRYYPAGTHLIAVEPN